MDERWKTNIGSVYNVCYHMIWCSKYRRKVLTGEVETRLKQLLSERSAENGWQLEGMEVMPDHVHLFIKATPSDSPAHIVSQLKGYTSFKLREEFKWLRSRLPTVTRLASVLPGCRNTSPTAVRTTFTKSPMRSRTTAKCAPSAWRI